MKERNLSPQKMFQEMARANPPRYSFHNWRKSYQQWKEELYPQVIATLGEFPAKTPLEAELAVEWRVDGLKKQKWMINVGEFASAYFVIFCPDNLGEGEKRPGILCWHGHGTFGKDSVMGDASSPERADQISRHNYDYGLQMAKAGYVTFAIDWIGYGDRNDAGKPHFLSNAYGRDWCNLYYLHATMLGMTSLSINIAHGMAAVDFAETLPYVDAERLGVMGLSGGGTMALWSSLVDERLKATEIICYSELWQNFGFRDINYCGMQVAPGLYRLVDLPDLQGLLAPRPLLIDIGVYDTCFDVNGALECYRRLEQIYAAADASDRLLLDLAAVEHGWCGNRSLEFFNRWLSEDK